MQKMIHGAGEMQQFAGEFVATLSPSREATVLALTGDLGSGKTTFVQGVARTLGITEPITSPTYVIEKIYPLENQPFERLVHIDAYRLKNTQELLTLGFTELLKNPQNLICIEWPGQIPGAIPPSATTLTFRFVDEGTREVGW